MRHHGPSSTVSDAGRSDHHPWVQDDGEGKASGDVESAPPAAHDPDAQPPFHVFVDDDRIIVTGSIDTFQAERLAQALAGSSALPAAVLDLSQLEFIDVAGCREIARWAGDMCTAGGRVEIRGASRLFRRIWRVLALDRAAPVTFAGVSA